MNEIKTFTQGGLNYDTEPHLMPKDDWIDAINVRMGLSDEQQEGAAINIEGNVRIGEYNYADGENKCVGAFSDEFRNVIYAFICNSDNNDEIIEIDPATGIITPVFKNLLWTNNVDVTLFEPWIKIHSIDIIHRPDDEGDLLFWVQSNTRPRKINIAKAKAYNTPDGYPDPILIDYTLVAKKAPIAPTFSISVPFVYGYFSDFTRPVNNLRGHLFQFQIRFVYDDYEKSVWSGWGNYDIPIVPFEPGRDSDPVINNGIYVGIPTGDYQVKKIEIGVRQNIESQWSDTYLVETLDKEAKGISDNIIYAYPFYNDTVGVLQLPAETNQVWDFVPTIAGCQALANGNTLVYGDITEGLKFPGPLNVIIQPTTTLVPPTVGADYLGWKFHGKYRLGLVYFDEFKRTDGVHTYVLDEQSDNDFDVTMPGYTTNSEATDNYGIYSPVINASIYHAPPIWAKTYRWVRTVHLNYGYFMYYVVFAVDTPDTNNVYFYLDAMYNSITQNGQEALSYDFVPGDRIRIIRRMQHSVPPYSYPDAQMFDVDLSVLEVLKDPKIFTTDFVGTYLKASKTAALSTAGPGLYLIELYRTGTNTTNTEFFYEFDNEYAILNPGDPDTMAHGGMTQNQDRDANLPASFIFTKGDVYYRPRAIMQYQKDSFYTALNEIFVEDPSYSDKYISGVSGNGRAFIVDDNQKEQRLPSLIRFGGAYIQDTFINKTNNFPASNVVDDCSRDFGIIKRLTVRNRQLRVYQELKCGWIPISQTVLQTTTGNSIVSQSDQLLNNIQYYDGEFGIGNAACSLATKNFADYFHDTNRGVICRLSRDGLTPISITGKVNSFCIQKDIAYTDTNYVGYKPPFSSDVPGEAQIYGVFDTRQNTYISAYEEMAIYILRPFPQPPQRDVVSPAVTLVWDEVRNRFIGRWLLYPEWLTVLKNDLIVFKNGIPYIQNDKDNRCRFFGEDSEWSLDLIFNDRFAIKKTFQSLDILSNQSIPAPAITTSLGQASNLIDDDYSLLEGHYHAALLRDSNSPGGVIDGDTLKGGYLRIQLKRDEAQSLISLKSAGVGYIVSQQNNQ